MEIKPETSIDFQKPPREKICDLNYVTDMMGGKKHLIKEIIDVFLKQVPLDLYALNDAITRIDYPNIKIFSHSLKSSVSIMGISTLGPILHEMGELAGSAEVDESRNEKIQQLNIQLHSTCGLALKEIESEQDNYI